MAINTNKKLKPFCKPTLIYLGSIICLKILPHVQRDIVYDLV